VAKIFLVAEAGRQSAVPQKPHRNRITPIIPIPPIRPNNSVNFVNSVQINHPILSIPREREKFCAPCENHRVNDELSMKKANTASEAGTPCRGTWPSAFIVILKPRTSGLIPMSIQNETKTRRIWEGWPGASEAHTRRGLQRASNAANVPKDQRMSVILNAIWYQARFSASRLNPLLSLFNFPICQVLQGVVRPCMG
jgi:hypothetical protein